MRRLILCLLLAGLAACESTPVRMGEDEGWLQHRQRVLAQDDWRMQGRVAIRHADEGGQGLLHWEQRGETYTLHFYDALNRLQLQIEGDDQGVEMKARSGETRKAADAELLMQEYLGWSVPVASLRYWVRGLPEPQQSVDEFKISNDRLSRISQGNWDIRYQRYEQVDGIWLPDLLKIEAPSFSIKLLVEQWSLS